MIWVYGTLAGRPLRQSMKTRDWTLATLAVGRMESQPDAPRHSLTIASAVKQYLSDCRARNLCSSTITSYQNVVQAFVEHCERRNLRELQGLRLDEFRSFREERDVAISTQRKEIEHLRAFCRFCLDADWIPKNYASKLKPAEGEETVTMPYERDEIRALIVACDQIDNNYLASAMRARKRARALLLLMLYSGMRVSDALRVERSRLRPDGRLLMWTMKTGVPLYVRLHPACVDALLDLDIESRQYFLWSGKGKISSATGSARRTVECVSRISGVEARPHRFRDTFAVELLLLGEDIRTVQLLLGHKSIKTTEKHYAPYVRGFQTRLDDATAKLHFEEIRPISESGPALLLPPES